MKVRTSYFYQIRNFKKNMIPMSTVMSDPAWYHNNQDKTYTFIDKRGILNGLRLLPVIVQGNCGNCCPCETKDANNCPLRAPYEFELSLIDFDKMYKGMEQFCNNYCKENKIEEEPIAVLIVYETPDNNCSERSSLQKLFNSHGIECRELDYPINNPTMIKNEPFDF